MAKQFSTTVRDAWLATYESTISTTPHLHLRTGAPPANCAAANTGTDLVNMTLPSDWMAAPSSGTAGLAGTWSGSVIVDGAVGHYRIMNSADSTCHEQGIVTKAFSLTTSASTAAASNVLTFASTTGVANGQSVVGTGVPTGCTVLAFTSTTATLSAPSTAGVSSSTVIYFGDTTGDLWLNSTSLTAGQTVTISSRSLTAPGA